MPGYYDLTAEQYASLTAEQYYTLPLMGTQESTGDPRRVVAYQAYSTRLAGAAARLVESHYTDFAVHGETGRTVKTYEVGE